MISHTSGFHATYYTKRINIPRKEADFFLLCTLTCTKVFKNGRNSFRWVFIKGDNSSHSLVFAWMNWFYQGSSPFSTLFKTPSSLDWGRKYWCHYNFKTIFHFLQERWHCWKHGSKSLMQRYLLYVGIFFSPSDSALINIPSA